MNKLIFTWKTLTGKTTGYDVRHTRTSIHYLQIRLQSRLTASHLRLLIRNATRRPLIANLVHACKNYRNSTYKT